MSRPPWNLPLPKAAWPTALPVLLVVALLAALHLHYPLHVDQSMFMNAAREFADGARMYREYWDMKQPGIYWWYEAAGSIFGFDALGLRWMDLLWSITVAWVLWAALRSRGTLAAVLGPCLAFGTFYGRATDWHLSQVEWLVCGPIAVVLWCVARTPEAWDTRRLSLRYAIAGAMVATVGLFKSMAVLIPLAMLAVDVAFLLGREAWPWRRVSRACALPFVGGAVLVLLPVAAWMQWDGTLAPALWTAFVYPPQAVREYAHNPQIKFLMSFRWFLVGTVTVVPWALWAVFNGIRRGLRIELLCITWCLGALVVIAMQVLSYWEYHFDLMYIPVGVLAALGFVDVAERTAVRGQAGLRRAALGLLVLSLILSPGWPLVRKMANVSAPMPFLPERPLSLSTPDPREKAYRELVDRVTNPSDRIIVWGDPRVYGMVGRRPVVQVDGATFYLAEQVRQVASLIRRQPPPLIWLSKERDRMTYHAGGVLPRTVQELYEPIYEDDEGVWYRRRSSGP